MKAKTQECSPEPQDPSHLKMMKTQRSNPNARLPPATRNVGRDTDEDFCTGAVAGEGNDRERGRRGKGQNRRKERGRKKSGTRY